ncbi:MAG TPA: sugar phosphate isomerase/epimerase family protein [Bryobacteraceae bacterium]|nr:sugar phosphate isomerase/epimerase family protein [Bryobacteraceae bacterium]
MNRRDFIKAAAALGTAISMPGSETSMYVSLNGSLTGGKLGWPEFASLAATTGFGGVDVNLSAAMKQGVDATRALFAELKIKPSNVNLPVTFGRDEEAFQTSLKQLPDAASFCAAIQCPAMLAVLPPASQTPKTEFRKIVKERLSAIGEILSRTKLRLGLEFLGPLHFRTALPHEFIWRMDETLEFAKECGPSVGLLLDVWHWHHAGATTADILKAGTARIVHVHLSDCPKMPADQVRDNQRVLPGEGVIDLVGFFRALKTIGYRDGVSPEPIGRIPKDMSAEEGARLGLDTALTVMRKAGVA